VELVEIAQHYKGACRSQHWPRTMISPFANFRCYIGTRGQIAVATENLVRGEMT
jgi:hypothetical protein